MVTRTATVILSMVDTADMGAMMDMVAMINAERRESPPCI